MQLPEEVTASQLAFITGKSKQWICQLCREGRIEGARRVGHVWMVPLLAKLPLSNKEYWEKRKEDKWALKEAALEAREGIGYIEKEGPGAWAMMTETEKQILKFIREGLSIDQLGRVAQRVPEGTEGAFKVADGVWLKQVFKFEGWGRVEGAFFTTQGGITDASKLPVKAI